MQRYAITEVYTNEYSKNQFRKLVALTDGAVTREMSVMHQEKLNILSNYWVSNKIKY